MFAVHSTTINKTKYNYFDNFVDFKIIVLFTFTYLATNLKFLKYQAKNNE